MKNIFFVLVCVFVLSCKGSKDEEELNTDKPLKEVPQEDALKEAFARYPDSLPLLQNLLGYYAEKEDYDIALDILQKAIIKDSTDPQLYDLQSSVYAAKGDTINAISSLRKAIKIFPTAEYTISLGALYAETKNPLALAMADTLLKHENAHAEKEAFFIKGLYYSFNNEKEKSIPFFDKALAKDFHFMEGYLEKGLALYDLKKYKEAADVFTRAVTLQNNFDRGYFYLGQSLEKLNRKEDAADAYQKALLYDPEYTEAKEALNNLGF